MNWRQYHNFMHQNGLKFSQISLNMLKLYFICFPADRFSRNGTHPLIIDYQPSLWAYHFALRASICELRPDKTTRRPDKKGAIRGNRSVSKMEGVGKNISFTYYIRLG
jgi:hypothetical protein